MWGYVGKCGCKDYGDLHVVGIDIAMSGRCVDVLRTNGTGIAGRMTLEMAGI